MDWHLAERQPNTVFCVHSNRYSIPQLLTGIPIAKQKLSQHKQAGDTCPPPPMLKTKPSKPLPQPKQYTHTQTYKSQCPRSTPGSTQGSTYTSAAVQAGVR